MLVSDGVEGLQHVLTGFGPPLMSDGQDPIQEPGALLVRLFLPGLEALHLDVQIPNVAESVGYPAQLLPEPAGPLGQSFLEDLHRGPHPARRHAHVVQLFRVFAEPRARLVVLHLGELSTKHGERDLAQAHGRVYECRAELGASFRIESAGVQTSLVLGDRGWCQFEGRLHLVHETKQVRGRGHADPGLYLHTSQAGRLLAQGYLRGVERDLADAHVLLVPVCRTLEQERETLAAGLDAEKWAHLAPADERSRSPADGPPGLLQRRGFIVLEGLGDLTPPPEAALDRRQGFHRGLDCAIRVADAQSVAGPVETPVISVVVGVCDLNRGFRGDEETRRT